MSTICFTEILSRAKNWLEQDPDPETREELSALIDTAHTPDAQNALIRRFSSRLSFGTAGLRGALEAGSMGMNRVLVAQTAKGLAQYLLSQADAASVVIGYDARKNSWQFAKDSAEILQGAGVQVYLMPRTLPTPMLAYAVRALNASAGVMVTASHNPPQDNGYKVYLGKAHQGAQIIAPADSQIAAQIEKAAQISIKDYPRDKAYQLVDETIIQDYISQTASILSESDQGLKIVYTAMHGVGKETFLRILQQAGHALPHLVASQCEPDAQFPTVAFPNPEEKGALDLAIAEAIRVQADVIIAHDPDADRLAVAMPSQQGQWQILHGNTIGALLGWEIAKKAVAQGKSGTLACSLVSGMALKNIAKQYQLEYVETLTGFKWISRAPNLLFGYEEAIGFLVDPDKVKDKDGLSAACAWLNLLHRLKKENREFEEYMAEFNQLFGAHQSGQISLRYESIEEAKHLIEHIRANPFSKLGEAEIIERIDHLQTDKQSNILVYHTQNARLVIRPSGTEAKLKLYLDVQAQTTNEAYAAYQQLETDVKNLLNQYVNS